MGFLHLSSLFSHERESGPVDKQFSFSLRQKLFNFFPVLFFTPFFSLLVLFSCLFSRPFPQMFSGGKPKYNFRINQSEVRRSNRERKERITRERTGQKKKQQEQNNCMHFLLPHNKDQGLPFLLIPFPLQAGLLPFLPFSLQVLLPDLEVASHSFLSPVVAAAAVFSSLLLLFFSFLSFSCQSNFTAGSCFRSLLC